MDNNEAARSKTQFTFKEKEITHNFAIKAKYSLFKALKMTIKEHSPYLMVNFTNQAASLELILPLITVE